MPATKDVISIIAMKDKKSLTKIEREVVALLYQGKTYKMIAQEMQRSPSTIRTHVHSVLKKLEVFDRAQAVIKAAQLGLIDIPAQDLQNQQNIEKPEITDDMIDLGAQALPANWSLQSRRTISQRVLTAALQ